MSSQVANHQTDTKCDGGSLVGMLAHCFVGCLGFRNTRVLDIFEKCSSAGDRAGQTLAGRRDIFFENVGCSRQQRTEIADEGVFVVTAFVSFWFIVMGGFLTG